MDFLYITYFLDISEQSHLMPSLEMIPFEYRMNLTRILRLSVGEEITTLFAFDAVLWSDERRRTDGQMDISTVAIPPFV